jgi:dihydrolipoamide dehydrogenase
MLEFEKEGQAQYLSCERVLLATGRKPRLDSIELEKLGVDLNASKKGVAVNGFMQTSNPDVYAIGDLTNIIQLAHVASHQGMVAAEHIGGVSHEMSYDAVPSAIFTHPEIGSVGLTEACAKAQDIPCETGLFPFAANGKALAMDETKGFVKLVRNSETGVLIGGTIIGPRATDMLSTLVHLMDEKIVLKDALHTIYAHPTASEGVHEALLALEGRMIHFG